MGDEGLYLLEKVELPRLPVRQKLRIIPGLVVAHARLIDELDAAQKFNVHVAFVTGTLRLRAGASAPSAMNHFAFGSRPVSSSKVESLTPVHSAQETRPCSACTLA